MDENTGELGGECYFGHFRRISTCKVNDTFTIKKFRSEKTGLTIVIGAVPGPMVHGCFALGTEAFDDDGIPHTLEHLVFLGSEDYPYKGVLDIVANRCVASGTNAWTDNDHTAYTLFTAGVEGFLTILPIYVDHILFATLTEAAFTTEIHHVTGEGKDAGVVYCEMQGRETTAESLTEREFMMSVYPGNCSYRYESGGIVKNLRENTNLPKIRDFHSRFYRAQNLILIITGDINEQDVFRVLLPLERKVMAREYPQNFEKPLRSDVPRLRRAAIRTVKYPSDQEKYGMVIHGFQGPSTRDQHTLFACSALFLYLTETSSSPLQRYFVECNNPYCSEISYTIVEHSTCAMYFDFKDVRVEKIPRIRENLYRVLYMVLRGTRRYEIDLTRMKTVLSNWQLKELSKMEKDPHDEIAKSVILDFLYGENTEDLFCRMNPVKEIQRLIREPVEFWQGILKTYFIKRSSVTVMGYPSKEEYKKNGSEEELRIKNQREALGPEGLSAKAALLNEAIRESTKKPPEEIIRSIPTPKIIPDKLAFFPMSHYHSNMEIQPLAFNCTESPVFMQLDHVESQFLYIYIILNSRDVPSHLRMYLPIVIEYILDAPVRRGSKMIDYDTVSEEMEEDLLTYKTMVGIDGTRFSCGQFSDAILFNTQISPKKYPRAIKWINEILYCTHFSKSRLKTVAEKMIGTVSQARNNGSSTASDLLHLILFGTGTNIDACMPLQMEQVLLDIISKLEAGGDEENEILYNFGIVRDKLTDPKNIVVHLAADTMLLLARFEKPSEHLKKLLPPEAPVSREVLDIRCDYTMLLPPERQVLKSCVTGMASVDSAFMSQAVPCIHDFYHPDLAALLVFVQYITQLEGPVWREIRGFGLAYSYEVSVQLEEGVIYLHVYKSSDVAQTYEKMKRIVLDTVTVEDIDLLYFESAKSSLVYERVEKERIIKEAVAESLLTYLTKTDYDYNRTLIKKILDVDINDMKRVGLEYVAPLFDPDRASTAVVCHGSKCQEVAEAFKKLGVDLEVYESLEDSILNPKHPLREELQNSLH